MNDRRVRPNGLLVGSAHPPIFHDLLHQRTGTDDWGHVYSTNSVVMTLARKLASAEYVRAPRPAINWRDPNRPYEESFGSMYAADEGSDWL